MLRKLQTLVESTTAPTTFHTSAADPPAAKAPRNCVGVLRVPGRVRAVASFGPSLIAVTGSNPVVRLFRDGVLALELAGHADEVNSVEFSPDGQMLLTASDDASVRCWDVAAGTSAHVMQQTCRVYCARFVPPVAASGRVVACDWDGRVWLWELGANEALRTFQVHRHVVMGVAVSADGSMFASASWDHTGVVADLGSGDMLARLDLQNDEMNTVRCPTGKG
jgi:WD40 repeat protein